MRTLTTSATLAVVTALIPAAPAAQTPHVSPLRDLAGDALIGLATGDQQSPAIARGANGYLVAWADRRADLFTNAGSDETGLDVLGLRLDANGQQIESVPIALSIAPGADSSPLVAWNGQSWLVAWKAQAPLASIYSTTVVGVRVSSAGQVLDASPIAILSYPFSEVGSMVLASDGNNWVVAAQGTSGGSADLRAARVSPAGVVLDAAPVALLPEGQLGTWQLAYAQGAFLLVWSESLGATGEDVVGRRFDSSLAWLDAFPFVIGRTTSEDVGPRVGSNGTQFLVAWQSVLASIWSDVRVARVGANGQLIDTTSIPACDLFAYGTGPSSAPAWDGVSWYLEWNYFGPRFARVSGAGAVLDYGGFLADATPNSTLVGPRLAPATNGGVLLAWGDGRAGSYEGLDVYTSRVVDAGNVGVHTGISTGASAQVGADVATDGTGYAVVYRSETSGACRILVSRTDAQGLPLDPEPIEIANGSSDAYPSIAWDGARYLIVWERGGTSILGRRMAQDGTLLDAGDLAIGTGTTPEASGMAGEFLVAFTRAVAYPLQQFPNVVRVRGSDGALLGAPVAINSNYAIEPDVCVLGGEWLVVWQRNYWNNDPHCDVFACFVDAAGVPGVPFWVAGNYNAYNHSVAVAASDTEAMFVWVNGPAASLARRVHARRIAPGGGFLDAGPVAVVGVQAQQFNPTLAWDGTQYLVAFQDLRNATSSLDQRGDVYGTRIRRDGVIVDAQGFLIESTAASEVGPALAARGSGAALVASSTFRAEAPHSSYRIGVRTIDGVCPTPTTYCTAKVTSIGTLPAIGTLGSPSIGTDDLRLTVTGGVPHAPGIHFFGLAPASSPFFQGVRCASVPIVRSPITTLDSNGSAQVALPLEPEMLGQTRYYQWWLRDGAHPDGTGIALSDAVAVTICP